MDYKIKIFKIYYQVNRLNLKGGFVISSKK